MSLQNISSEPLSNPHQKYKILKNITCISAIIAAALCALSFSQVYPEIFNTNSAWIFGSVTVLSIFIKIIIKKLKENTFPAQTSLSASPPSPPLHSQTEIPITVPIPPTSLSTTLFSSAAVTSASLSSTSSSPLDSFSSTSLDSSLPSSLPMISPPSVTLPVAPSISSSSFSPATSSSLSLSSSSSTSSKIAISLSSVQPPPVKLPPAKPAEVPHPVKGLTKDYSTVILKLNQCIRKRSNDFSSLKIKDIDQYAFDILDNLFTTFNVSYDFAPVSAVNRIFCCLAFLLLREATVIDGCPGDPKELSIKSAFIIKPPTTLYKQASPGSKLRPIYFYSYLGELDREFLALGMGLPIETCPPLDLLALKSELEKIPYDTFTQDICLIDNSHLGVRVLGWMLYNSFFAHYEIYKKKAARKIRMPHTLQDQEPVLLSDCLLKTIQKTYETGLQEGYFSLDDWQIVDKPPIFMVALLEIVGEAIFSEKADSQSLILEYEYSMHISKNSYFMDKEGALSIRWCTDHIFAQLNFKDYENNLTDEVFKLKILLNNLGSDSYKRLIQIIINPKRKSPKSLTPVTKAENEALSLLAIVANRLMYPKFSDILGKAAPPLLESKTFKNKLLCESFFKKFFDMSARSIFDNIEEIENPDNIADEAGINCLSEAFAYYLSKIKKKRRPGDPKEEPPHKAIGKELQKKAVAESFVSHVGIMGDGSWLSAPSSATDAEKIRVIQAHGLQVEYGRAWGGIPEIMIFSRMHNIQVHLFVCSETSRYRVNVGEGDLPVPDHTFRNSRDSGKPVLNIILIDNHYYCGWPKTSK